MCVAKLAKLPRMGKEIRELFMFLDNLKRAETLQEIDDDREIRENMVLKPTEKDRASFKTVKTTHCTLLKHLRCFLCISKHLRRFLCFRNI